MTLLNSPNVCTYGDAPAAARTCPRGWHATDSSAVDDDADGFVDCRVGDDPFVDREDDDDDAAENADDVAVAVTNLPGDRTSHIASAPPSYPAAIIAAPPTPSDDDDVTVLGSVAVDDAGGTAHSDSRIPNCFLDNGEHEPGVNVVAGEALRGSNSTKLESLFMPVPRGDDDDDDDTKPSAGAASSNGADDTHAMRQNDWASFGVSFKSDDDDDDGGGSACCCCC